jgi:two-component system, cell cycle response regulator DivK
MATGKGATPTVLVVEDNEDIRRMVRVMLEASGYGVVEAKNGREAVELAPEVHPDLILMDLSMPVLDGYEATRQIHGRPDLHGVPIVAVSAHRDARQRQKALAAGCIECLGKPVDFDLLDGLLKKHLQAH